MAIRLAVNRLLSLPNIGDEIVQHAMNLFAQLIETWLPPEEIARGLLVQKKPTSEMEVDDEEEKKPVAMVRLFSFNVELNDSCFQLPKKVSISHRMWKKNQKK